VHNEVLHNLHSSLTIVKTIKSTWKQLVKQVARKG